MIDGQTTEPKQKTRIILAPMQGLVDDVMRDLLTRIGGYDECVSEFVRALPIPCIPDPYG